MWGWTSFNQFRRDVQYGTRLLTKNPGFTSVAVLTLALGIGAGTAIFSLVQGLLLKPLPYHNARELVVPATIFQRSHSDRGSVAYADILDWKAETDLFAAVAAYRSSDVDISGKQEPERQRAIVVDDRYFEVMGVPPLAGRTLQPQDQLPGASPSLVLTYDLWMRRYGGDRSAIGTMLELNGVRNTIVGVMPKDSTWPSEAGLILPLGTGAKPTADTLRRDNHIFQAVARLRGGMTVERAQVKMTTMGARIAQQFASRKGTNWKLHALDEWIVGPTMRTTLWVLLGAVVLVLLIACVNVANLLVARGAAREREVAVRSALGASFQRLAGQFLVEGVLLTLAGAAAGCLLGHVGLRALIHFAPPHVPRLDTVTMDGTVFAFTAAVSVLTALVAGLIPAIQAGRMSSFTVVREGGRTLSSSARSARVRQLLVVSELALAILLLAGAGLMIRSFQQLLSVQPGFSPHNVITMQVGLPRARYSDGPQRSQAFQQIADAMARIPSVVSASAVSSLPVDGGGFYLGRAFLFDGQAEPPATQEFRGAWSVALPGYFRTMGIPVLHGRAIDEHDTATSTPVMMISKRMARQMFGDDTAIGKRIRSWRDENVYREVIGVVGDIQYDTMTEEIGNNVYVPHTQNSWGSMLFTVRTVGQPEALLKDLRNAVWSVDSKLAISPIKTMDRIIEEDLARPRFSMFLLGIFGATAMLLAAIGIYGVMSFAVTQRTREIGIRMALGAERKDVLGMIAGRAMLLVSMGVAAGLAGAVGLTRLMKGLLFGVSPTDTLTFAGVSALLMLVGLAASYLPARRATKVDPIITLRE